MDNRSKNGSFQANEEHLTDKLESNLERFRETFGKSPDLIIRKFSIGPEQNLRAAIIYLENLADQERINEHILQPITGGAATGVPVGIGPRHFAEYIRSQLVTASSITPDITFEGIAHRILAGETVLLIEGVNEGMVFNTRGWAEREIGQPQSEATIRGPRESFVESYGTNITLLRRRISHPDLMIETCKVGCFTGTNVGIVYLNGVVNEKVVAEVKHRLERIQTDGILGAGAIEQLIGDAPLSLFSTVSYSERPDVVAGKILEGRVALVIDGNPEVLTVPTLLVENFQNPDDYNSNFYYTTLIRWIRYIAFGFSILGPAVYLALSSYHHELIPTPLFINIAAGAEGTPFPVFVELIIIGLLFEIFREAGIRLPKPVLGQGITFVAALVLAQASITMGLVGVATVVVVTITAISSLVNPQLNNTSLILRLMLAILAAIFGAYGILLGLLWILTYAVSLRSFGVPYLAPIAPFNPRDFQQDVLFKAPIWAMGHRPRTIGWLNSKRQGEGLKPSQSKENELDHTDDNQ